MQKKGELLKNVSFVCVAGNCEMLVYFSFFPNNSLNIGFDILATSSVHNSAVREVWWLVGYK